MKQCINLDGEFQVMEWVSDMRVDNITFPYNYQLSTKLHGDWKTVSNQKSEHFTGIELYKTPLFLTLLIAQESENSSNPSHVVIVRKELFMLTIPLIFPHWRSSSVAIQPISMKARP